MLAAEAIRPIDDLPNAGELRKVKLPEPKEEGVESSPEEQLALSATEKAAQKQDDAPAESDESPEEETQPSEA